MAARRAQSGIPVVIDEWTIQLWADAKVPAADAARLVAIVDTALAGAAAALGAVVNAAVPGDGAPAKVVIAARGR